MGDGDGSAPVHDGVRAAVAERHGPNRRCCGEFAEMWEVMFASVGSDQVGVGEGGRSGTGEGEVCDRNLPGVVERSSPECESRCAAACCDSGESGGLEGEV